jgi:hypothetical protein
MTGSHVITAVLSGRVRRAGRPSPLAGVPLPFAMLPLPLVIAAVAAVVALMIWQRSALR